MVRTKHVRMAQNITPGDSRGRQQGPRQSPTKWVWWGEEESPKGISSGHSGTTELLPRKAKRRMRSLRRRGTPFSPIFLQTKKDGATGGRQLPSAAGKNVKQNDCTTGGRKSSRAASKIEKRKMPSLPLPPPLCNQKSCRNLRFLFLFMEQKIWFNKTMKRRKTP